MRRTNLRLTIAALLCAITLLIGTTGSAAAANQTGLVNVDVSNIAVAIPVAVAVPVSVALPVGIAANLCGISAALAVSQGTCTATNTSSASSNAQALARLFP